MFYSLLWLVVVSFHVVWTSEPLVAISGVDEGNGYTVNFRSPNITLVNDGVFVCLSADLPLSSDISYVVKLRPTPIPGAYFHIFVHSCDESGQRDLPPGHEAWECGEDFFTGRNPPLLHASQCSINSLTPRGDFQYQFQGGSPDEGTLVLPPGTGIPVGGQTGQNAIVVAFHFPDRTRVPGGITAGAGLEVTLSRNETRPAYISTLYADGFVGPQSLGWVSGSMIVPQAIQPLVVYVHGHDWITTGEIVIKRASGESEILLHQNMASFRGVTAVDSRDIIIFPGDRVSIKCWFNNTLSVPLRVRDTDMCIMDMTYVVSADEEPLLPILLHSVDPVFKSCLQDKNLYDHNWFGESSFRPAFPDQVCQK